VGRRHSGVLRAALTGTASGLVFGIADALTRTSVQILDGRNPAHLLLTWPGYATVATTLVGLWLMQNAFNAAPLHASLPAVTAAEPAAGIVLGVVVFGDVVHVSTWLLALQAASIAAIVGGVILVARAPVFRDLRLRQLPHVARERLQHPGPHGPARDPGAADPPRNAGGRRQHANAGEGRPRVLDDLPPVPGSAPRVPGGAPRVPGGKSRVPGGKSLVPEGEPLVPDGKQREGTAS
jgi:hypothetical protein